MKKQFVTYEIALKLKELGFDESCFGYYTIMKDWMMKSKYSDNKLHFHGPNWANNDNTMRFMYLQNSFGDRDSTVKNSEFTKAIENIAVPLWQQVVDWFREKHKIRVSNVVSTNEVGAMVTHFIVYTKYRQCHTLSSSDYYDAREQAILKAIELCKKN